MNGELEHSNHSVLVEYADSRDAPLVAVHHETLRTLTKKLGEQNKRWSQFLSMLVVPTVLLMMP